MHFFKRSKNGYGYFWRSLINSIFPAQAFLPPDTSHVRLQVIFQRILGDSLAEKRND